MKIISSGLAVLLAALATPRSNLYVAATARGMQKLTLKGYKPAGS